jgi:serine/threonine protein kinase
MSQGRHRKTNQIAALKVIEVENEEELKEFQVEINILKEMNHQNIIKLFESYYHNNTLWVCGCVSMCLCVIRISLVPLSLSLSVSVSVSVSLCRERCLIVPVLVTPCC